MCPTFLSALLLVLLYGLITKNHRVAYKSPVVQSSEWRQLKKLRYLLVL